MPYLYLINAYGALVSHYGFTTIYRIPLPGVPISFLDLFLIGAIVISLLRGPINAGRYPVRRIHPLFRILIACWATATVFGLTAGILNGNDPKDVFSDMREYMSMGGYAVAGYTLMTTPKAARRFVTTLAWLGFGTATLLLFNFGANAEQAGAEQSYNLVRETTYNEMYGGVAAPFFAYLLLTNSSRLPAILLACVSGYCFVGDAAPLTRSDWIAVTLGFLVLILILPREKRFMALIRFFVLGLVLVACIALGITLAASLMHRDFASVVEKRAHTLNPFEEAEQGHAWDSRINAYGPELHMFMHNPLMGSGFGAQQAFVRSTGVMYWGLKHNGWSSMLAEAGIFAFAGAMITLGSMLLISFRMARDSIDTSTRIVGAYALLTGVYMTIYVLATMAWNARNSLLMGATCGVMFRCRDLQLANLEQEHLGGYFEPLMDEADYDMVNPLVPNELVDVEPFAR